MLFLVLAMTSAMVSAGKSWSNDHQDHSNHIDITGTPKSHLDRLEVVCSRDHMTVHMHFDHPFYGMVFSHSGPRHERCVHVGPRAGVQDVSFHIKYDSCGTVEDLGGQFHENTIVVQFGEDILEAWDEAKRLRCEWLETFEKPSSKPTLAISDIDVVELNFQGDDIDCWMEIQEGKGPWARQVGGLVPIGSPLTLVIAINDHTREFDMRIKRCSATDGTGSEIELTDHNGCVLRPSLLTPFAKVKDLSTKATLVAYSHLYAFKFPDKMDVYVHCVVEVCRHGCSDSCNHQSKDYFHSRGPFDTLESKKHVKLAKPAHQIHVTGHHLPSKSTLDKFYPGRERNREILVPAAQQQIQQIVLKNNTSLNTAASESRKVFLNQQRATFKPKSILQAKDKAKETKSDSVGASSNVQSVFTDIGNNLHSDHDSRLTAGHNDHAPVHATYHRIIGHDAHWIAENDKKIENHHARQPISPLTHISYQAPQPEPATWSADEVKTLTKQEVYHTHHGAKPGPAAFSADEVKHLAKQEFFHTHQVPQPEPAAWTADEVKPLTKHEVFYTHQGQKSDFSVGGVQQLTKQQEAFHAHQVPQPEPATWSADEVKPLTEQQVFHAHQVPKLAYSVDEVRHLTKQQEVFHTHQVPQPEPASWSADEVKPLTKQEVFHTDHFPKPEINYNVPHFKSQDLHKTHIPWSPDEEIFHSHTRKITPENPQPEPAPWKFEDVNPMHSPEIFRLGLHTKQPDEPKPEPTSWTLEDVKPLSKEALRLISLNHKFKNNPHLVLPEYKEFVHPYSTSTIPQPVYVSRYTVSPQNMSMNMKMMMMPTLLPHTYQTAQWPQRATTRFLRPYRHHYPYPIPQFSNRQQMMMSVIGDRRMDGDDTTNEDLSLHHNLDSEETTNRGHILIGDTARSEMRADDTFSVDSGEIRKNDNATAPESEKSKQVSIGETFRRKAATPKSTDDTISVDSGEIRIDSKVAPPESENTKQVSIGESSRRSPTTLNFQTTSTQSTIESSAERLESPMSFQVSGDSGGVKIDVVADSSKTVQGASPIRPPVSGFVPPTLDVSGTDPETKDRAAHGPRALDRRKRSSDPVFGVQQKFQAIAASDLAFEWNVTADSTAVLRGRREEIVYGICMSPAGMSASVGFILILTLLSIIASVVLYEHSCLLTKKTSQLSFLTRNFNGRFEALYRITRPYLYSTNGNVR